MRKREALRLSDHFTYGGLLRFSLPTIGMMLFSSIYGIVDGYFVSNFAGKTDFAALNYIFPVLMILGTVGFMFGTGGSAVVAKSLGEGEHRRAEEEMSLLVLSSVLIGIILAVLGFLFMRPIATLLGAEGLMLERCVLYGRIVVSALPAFILQMEFQSFFVTAEKPKIGFLSTVVAGCINMLLDLLFVGVFGWELAGAAAATAISQLSGGLFPVLYFVTDRGALLHFVRPRWDGRVILRACTNGSSEFMANISMSLVGILYNIQLYRYALENGVSAYGVIMYVGMIFMAVFIGYGIGVAPIIGYHEGAKNVRELQSLLSKSLVIIGLSSVAMTILSELLAYPFSYLFVGYDSELLTITTNAFRIFSLAFLFIGYAIFGSNFFTALNDGVTSAIIAFLRTLVFQVLAVILLPLWLGLDGIWYSLIVAELMAVVMCAIFLYAKRERYQYWPILSKCKQNLTKKKKYDRRIPNMKKFGIETTLDKRFHGRFGDQQFSKMLEHGFAFCDLGLTCTEDPVYRMNEEEVKVYFTDLLRLAGESGIAISQVHGPWRYPPRDLEAADREERFASMSHSIHLCALLGVKYWVVHPIMPYGLDDLDTGRCEDTYRMNIEFMRRLTEVARREGVVICYENMPFDRFSLSTPAQIMRVVEEIDDEHFCVCLDTGHVNVFPEVSIADAVRRIGKKLRVLHIHDNMGDRDAHLWPTQGTIDWAAFKNALDEIGFDGVYSLETLPKGEMTDNEFDKQCLQLGQIAHRLFA